jgi:ubiquinone/menaquinone biosynthesis C-methylase UbiE
MSFYNDRVLPRLLNLAMRNKDLQAYRRRLVPAAEGRVLEIGIGSGLNLPFYGPGVTEVVGLDPSAPLLRMAGGQAAGSGVRVRLLEGSAEGIPLEDAGFDTVLTTWTLCSVRDAGAALAEIRRVLKPAGHLLFVEHGSAPDAGVARWQDRLTPLWKPIAGGCHLNRPIETLIRHAGFGLPDLHAGYMAGPRPFTFIYEGRASKG